MTETNRLDRHRPSSRALRGLVAAIVAASLAAPLSGCLAVRRSEEGKIELLPASAVKKPEDSKVEKTEQDSDSTGQSHPDDSAPAKLGTSLTEGNWEVTAVSAKERKRLPNGKKCKKGKTFLLVEVSIKNIGTAAELNVRPKQFWMTDSNGEKVKPYEADLDAFNAKSIRPIPIGMGARTTFVYHVPKGSDGYVFTFERRNTAKKLLHWRVP